MTCFIAALRHDRINSRLHSSIPLLANASPPISASTTAKGEASFSTATKIAPAKTASAPGSASALPASSGLAPDPVEQVFAELRLLQRWLRPSDIGYLPICGNSAHPACHQTGGGRESRPP
jgi:hypothetical protein